MKISNLTFLLLSFFFFYSCSDITPLDKEETLKLNQTPKGPMRSLQNSDYYSYLGFGVKDVTDEVTTNKIFVDNFEIRPVDCSEQSGWDYTITTEASELRDKIVSKFSTSAKGGYAGFSMSASFEKELTQENTNKTNNIYGVALMKIVKGEITMYPFDPNLKNSIRDILYKSKSPSDFRNIYGDKFISGAVLGGVIMVKFEFSNVDYSSNSSLSIKTNAEIAFKSIMSAKISFEEVKTKYSEFKNSNLRISCTSGGPILSFTDNISGIPSIINNAIDEINNNKNLTRILNKYTYYSDIINDYSFISTKKHNENKKEWVKYRSNLINALPCFDPTSDKYTEIVKKINMCNSNIKRIENIENIGEPTNDVKKTCLYPCTRRIIRFYTNLARHDDTFLITPPTEPIINEFSRDIYMYSNPDIIPNELIALYAVNNDYEYRYTTSADIISKYPRKRLVGYIFKSYHEGTVPLVEKVLSSQVKKKQVGLPMYKEEPLSNGEMKETLGFVVENPNLILD
ncbi:hypothetical protein [Alistipes sp. ZOR0009]|uniref:hypothetical protein n=1 Tax=Alistipes sp. ZOR0009 TaxID=1339253 RepID=UPI0006457280|nr:hypothetical protein [Alistipes sp. ZOR0009]